MAFEDIDELHECPVADCEEMIDIHRLMCFKHWRAVPPNLSSELWRARDWVAGREERVVNSGIGTRAYRRAFAACVDAVNQQQH